MSRRRVSANRSRQIAEAAAEDVREPKASKEEARDPDRETPHRSRAIKTVRRAERSRVLLPTSPAVPSRSEREEELSSDNRTPQRLHKCKRWTSTINSPNNDAEQQQDIFWDPHSPAPFKLEHGKKKQFGSKCTVDISDIVNRIAPKDEKPVNSDAAYLGVWIGDDAIPCTPVLSRARTKKNRSRNLHTEDELMKLARQLDRNLVEHKDQHVDVVISGPADTSVNTGPVTNGEDDSFLEAIPEENDLLCNLISVSQSSNAEVQPGSSSQKSVDQEAEAALNALFDSSTQKCSGRLSQGFSDVSTSSLKDVPEDAKNSVAKDILHKTNNHSHAKNATANQISFIKKSNSDTFQGVNKCSKQNAAHLKETLQSSDMVQPVSSSQDDFEDDWGTDILDDDSFMMEITQNPALIATPKNNVAPDKPCQSHLDASGGTVSIKATSSSSNKCNSFQFVPGKLNKCDEIRTGYLHSTENTHDKKAGGNPKERIAEKTFSSSESKVTPKSQVYSGVQASRNIKRNLEHEKNPFNIGEHSKCSNVTLKSLTSREEKDQPGKRCPQSVPQAHAVPANKDSVHMDDWDDPKFSDEVLDMFCDSDSLWVDKDDDDDLLYQVCDDVERLSQVQVKDEGNHKKENTLLQSSNYKTVTKMTTNSLQNGSHVTGPSSCGSNTLRFSAEHSSKITSNKGVTPAAVSGNCSNSYQNNSFLKTNQTSFMFHRSNSVPSGVVECKKPMLNESHSQNVTKPQTATFNVTNTKYSFTRVKPSQVISVHTKPPVNENESSLQIKDSSESKIKTTTIIQSSVHTNPQHSFKRHLSESTFQSSKVFVSEDRNKKCSMEEIERKKQEALARRNMRVRAFSNDVAPT